MFSSIPNPPALRGIKCALALNTGTGLPQKIQQCESLSQTLILILISISFSLVCLCFLL